MVAGKVLETLSEAIGVGADRREGCVEQACLGYLELLVLAGPLTT
jgi:hypothetical protein